MNCQICFTQSQDYKQCLNPFCKWTFCQECSDLFLDICWKEKKEPHCLNNDCQFILNSSYFTKKEVYLQLIKHLLENQVEQSEVFKTKNFLRQSLQTACQQVTSKFPLAIQTVVDLVLQDKVKERVKRLCLYQQQDEQVWKGKYCPDTFCVNGKLAKDLQGNWICLSCSKQTCEKCQQISKTGHQCSLQDLQSVEVINKMVKCPKCIFPVQRTYGCNNMTCPYCKTNFHFDTGKRVSKGNHHDLTLTLNYSFTSLLGGHLNPTQIEQLKALEPPPLTNKVLKNWKAYEKKNLQKLQQFLFNRVVQFLSEGKDFETCLAYLKV